MEWRFVKNGEVDFAAVEQALEVLFPEDFKQCVAQYNGGRPTPNRFDSSTHRETVMKSLLSFRLADKGNVLDVFGWIRNRLPRKVIPFANTPSGDYLCFDYRASQPNVVLWDHERASLDPEDALSFVADSFTALISKLY
jgi:hypothetical protein